MVPLTSWAIANRCLASSRYGGVRPAGIPKCRKSAWRSRRRCRWRRRWCRCALLVVMEGARDVSYIAAGRVTGHGIWNTLDGLTPPHRVHRRTPSRTVVCRGAARKLSSGPTKGGENLGYFRCLPTHFSTLNNANSKARNRPY